MEDRYARRFALIGALVAAIVSLIPFFLASNALRPAGAMYLGGQTANDDLMVYAAWMRQAMDGRIFFDNRFAGDQQQLGMTIHLYFLVLGWLAKVLGIVGSLTLARAAFNALAVWMTYQLLRRVTDDPFAQKLGVVAVSLGGGLGFLMWQNFGNAFASPNPFGALTMGRLPIDVWQPEAFVFPSMLVNGLFTASLCLILGIFICALDAKESAKPVLPGALAFLVLMNIHSYDVLLVALCLIGLLVSTFASKSVDKKWIGRVALMAVGALPAAAWFMYVLSADPVFQARAATETYSPNFKQVLFGLAPIMALGLGGIALARTEKRGPAAGAVGALILGLFIASGEHLDTNKYWMSMGIWIVAFVLALGIVWFIATDKPGVNLMASWAVIGLVAPYFPALFQRKLLMAASVPWAILGVVGLAAYVGTRDRGTRNLVSVFALLLVAGSSVQWLQRETFLARANVSSTTLHPVYVGRDVVQIIEALNQRAEPKAVVVAFPGIPSPSETPGSFLEPYLPDLNPILSGLSGVYSYAGHWSETPNYAEKRSLATSMFLEGSQKGADALRDLATRNTVYVVAPIPEAFQNFGELSGGRQFTDLRPLGETVVEGSRFRLIRVKGS